MTEKQIRRGFLLTKSTEEKKRSANNKLVDGEPGIIKIRSHRIQTVRSGTPPFIRSQVPSKNTSLNK